MARKAHLYSGRYRIAHTEKWHYFDKVRLKSTKKVKGLAEEIGRTEDAILQMITRWAPHRKLTLSGSCATENTAMVPAVDLEIDKIK